MKRKPLLLCLSLLVGLFSVGQNKSASIRSLTYAGAGWFFPSSGMNENSMIGNGVNFTFGHYQAIGKFTKTSQWGVEIRLDYSKFEKDLHAPPAFYSLYYNNSSGVPTIMPLALETEKKKPDAFHFLIGPSALFSCRKFLFHPSILAGYASVSQEKFNFYSKLSPPSDPSRDTIINFYSGGHETNNGFVIVPGIKAGYRFHKNIAAFISFEYSIGSTQNFSDTLYSPAGMPSPSGYDYYQLTHGTRGEYKRESKLRASLINFQLAFCLP